MQGGAAIHTSGLTNDFGQGHGVFRLDLEVRDGEIFGSSGVVGVPVAGGGIPVGHLAALSLHLACFGWALGALALTAAAVLSLRRRDLRKERRRRRPRGSPADR
ncbi:MAG TPA: hypothetical protein VH276_10885 [Solirubrobacteraceae bacterium]|nr:hypothetical protein [Solirubrobacteraceae bacterium]